MISETQHQEKRVTGPLISVKNLKKYFPLTGGVFSSATSEVFAVDGVNLELEKGKTVGLVGESGCGKSTTAKLLVRAIEPTSGEVLFNGRDVFKLSKKEMRQLRTRLQLVYQDPYSSLNPRMKIGPMIAEPLKVHRTVAKDVVEGRVASILEKVGLPPDSVTRYPHEFSGGQRQRIGIARALVLNPDVMILDEPVSALDVSVQAQVINLLGALQGEFDLSYLIIAHDLSLMKHICDRIAVMYLGKIVEEAANEDLYSSPGHPYTKALMAATPIPDPRVKRKKMILAGDVSSLLHRPRGCRFHARCPIREPRCEEAEPEFRNVGGTHWVACHSA